MVLSANEIPMKIMKVKFFLAGLIMYSAAFISQANPFPGDTVQLKAKAVYGKEAKIIAYILDNNHYRKIALNDSLSSVILTEYIKNLDNNKTYFTQSDIASFEKHRFLI